MHGKTFVVALTGGIGSGKSTIAGMFVDRGAYLIDTDVTAHIITAPGGRALAPLRAVFGDDVIGPEGALDRTLMRKRVFEDADAKAQLEAILHPMIREETDTAIGSDAASNAPYVILAVPLLFETMGYRDRVQRVLAVDCPVELQRQRVRLRSGLLVPQIDQILSSQLGRSVRLQLADDVISNSGDESALVPQVRCLGARYESLASTNL